MAALKIGEVNTGSHGLPGQRPPQESVPGGKTCTIMDGLWEAQCGQLRIKAPGNLVIGGPHHFVIFYLQELDRVLTVKIQEQFPHASSRGCRGALLKYATAVCSQ